MATRSVSSKPSAKLTLKDKLSRLTIRQAITYLKPYGERLLKQGGIYDINIDTDVNLTDHDFKLNLVDAELTLKLDNSARGMITWECSCQQSTCVHIGAALSLIMEEKTPLGLAQAPPEPTPVKPLSEQELINLALDERKARASKEKMRVRSIDKYTLWTDYMVTNATSGKTYRVALRGWQQGESYCTCPDFRKNTLGTCKHILHTITKAKKRFPANVRNKPFRQKTIALHLQYGENLELRLLLPTKLNSVADSIIKPLRNKPINDVQNLLRRIQKLEHLGQSVLIYPDAEEYIQQQLYQKHISDFVDNIRRNPANHPLCQNLLKVPLLPYQLDGAAFAVGAGRAVIADEMGLGKTIQGIAAAELLAQKADIKKVLVICPASLKSQWHIEIQRFCDRDCCIVMGNAEDRAKQYLGTEFFTLCNYEQVLRDTRNLQQQRWDLIILDEGQRIKNWESKTSQTVKALRSTFALVLTGTPLENRLDDLYSIIEFIDDRRLGPDFRFYNHHRVTDEKGKILGYKNMSDIREKLAPVLLRRTRASVQQQLPERNTEIIRIPATDQQLEIHQGFQITISTIIQKRYITEMDLLRLQKALLMCRMAANSTYLVDKQEPGYSSKLTELDQLLGSLSQESDRKIILFSEWTTMLNLIEPLLVKHKLEYVRLDGSVPQKQRQQRVQRFQNDADCRLFITTNAGAVGLNLQAANTIINVDLPWNPALLEQRIARAHRMGQKQTVQVFILVTSGTLEENLLATLSSKKQLAMVALDPDATLDDVDFSSGMEELRQRLEILLGATPDKPLDKKQWQQEKQKTPTPQQTRIANAGGQLLTSAFQFINELLPQKNQNTEANEQSLQMATTLEEQLSRCLTTTEEGALQLTVNLPDKKAVSALASAMANMLNMETA